MSTRLSKKSCNDLHKVSWSCHVAKGVVLRESDSRGLFQGYACFCNRHHYQHDHHHHHHPVILSLSVSFKFVNLRVIRELYQVSRVLISSIFTLVIRKHGPGFRHPKQQLVIQPNAKPTKTCGKRAITAKRFLGFTQCMFSKCLTYSRLATCSLSFVLPPPYYRVSDKPARRAVQCNLHVWTKGPPPAAAAVGYP